MSVALLVATVAGSVWLQRSRQVPQAGATGPVEVPFAPPRVPSALFVGDSYTAGTGAPAPRQGYACLTAEAMGWLCNLDAEGGTGFLNDGHSNSTAFQPFSGRLQSDTRKFLADVIIVDGGRNDGRFPVKDVIAAADSYLHALHAKWPQAPIVVVTSGYLWSTPENYEFGVELADGLRPILRQIHGHLIDPLEDRWVQPQQVSTFLWTDGIHPNASGHRYLANRLTEALQAAGLSKVGITDTRHVGQPTQGGNTG